MFEGEKTLVFWLGLIILGLVSAALFTVVWIGALIWSELHIRESYLRSLGPVIFGGIVFILIGLGMMKSGARIKEERKTSYHQA